MKKKEIYVNGIFIVSVLSAFASLYDFSTTLNILRVVGALTGGLAASILVKLALGKVYSK